MRIALISSEAVPFSKTGGLADVAGTLFREYNRMGVDASLFIPLYKVTAERFGGSLVDTGAEIDIPVGKIAKKCRVFTAAKQRRGIQGHGTVYFVSNDEYFGRDEMYCDAVGDYPDNDSRFVFFCKSVLEICRKFNLAFDVLHFQKEPSAWAEARGRRGRLRGILHSPAPVTIQGVTHWVEAFWPFPEGLLGF